MALNDNKDLPEGLDEFLAAPTTPDPMAMHSASPEPTLTNRMTGEPEGLDAFIEPELKQQKYGTFTEQAKTFAEGAGKGLIGPLAPLAEKALGVKEEDILAREEANPKIAMAGEVTGLVAPALATLGGSTVAQAGVRGAISAGAKLTQMGLIEAATKKLGLVAGETLASKIGTIAAKEAIQNMLIAGSDEVSKMVLHDPSQSADTAITNIGLAGVLGGALGGGAAGISEGAKLAWMKANGSKLGKVAEDFKARVKAHIDNPDPVQSITEELTNYHTQVKGQADEVYGASGLKSQDIAKALPEFSPKMEMQISDITSKVEDTLEKLSDDPLASKLAKELEAFKSATKNDIDPITLQPISAKSSAELFDAAQNLKQQLQEWGKFNKSLAPVAEHDFRNTAKMLSYDIRNALEDSNVWGKAADRQKAINKAFTEYLPALKDFEKRFTTDVGGIRQVDPAKINTYLNQIDKPNGEFKRDMLENYLNASEKYKKVIDETHLNLGFEPPLLNTSMNVTKASLGERTIGAQLADAFIEKGLKGAGGKGLGTAVGSGLGAILAGPMGATVGAVLGGNALGPLFSTTLPAISKRILENETSATGLKAAVDYISNVVKGEQLVTKAVKSVFKVAPGVGASKLMPSEKDRDKLNKVLIDLQENPQKLVGKDNPIQHYLPDNAMAADMTIGNAVAYLNSIRPDRSKKSPLDGPITISTPAKNAYANALNIAQQPLIVLDKIKDGSLTSKDMGHLSAMYPKLYAKLQTQLMDQMSDFMNSGGSLPHKTKVSMSMFLTQPLITSLTPSGIQAAQKANQGGINQPEQPQTKQAPKGTPSSPALQKMPQQYATSSQTLQQRNQKP